MEPIEFDTDDPELRGAMTMTWTLRDARRAAPRSSSSTRASRTSCRPTDNETGTRMSLTKLAAYVEGPRRLIDRLRAATSDLTASAVDLTVQLVDIESVSRNEQADRGRRRGRAVGVRRTSR